jgi:hypothetical protein
VKRNPLLLAAIFVLLLGLVVLLVVSGQGSPAKKRGGSEALYPDLDTSRVDRIEIRTSRGSADLFRDGPVWRTAKEDSFPADPDAVMKVLEAAAGFSARDIASHSAEKHEIFDVDSGSAIEVRLATGGTTSARFFVGKSGSDFQSTYVRDGGGVDVFRQAGSLKSVFDRGARTWKDKAVFRLDEEKMAAVELARKGETIRYENRGEAGWVVAKPEGYRSVGALAVAVARGLTKLTATDIVSKSDTLLTGLDAPEAVVRIELAGGGEKTLVIGAEKPGGGGRYAKRASEDVLYLVPSSRLANYIRPTEELIEPLPPDSALMPPPELGSDPGEKGPGGGD